jgi:hypothetical protein
VGNERRGAGGDSGVERRTVRSYLGEGDRGRDQDARGGDRGPRQLGKINVRLQNAGAAHADTDGVSTRRARVSLPGRAIRIVCVTVMIPISCSWMIVIVRRRAVMVIRVIVPDVLVDVQRRRPGRRNDQGLGKQERDEPAHEDSLLRPTPPLRTARGLPESGPTFVEA